MLFSTVILIVMLVGSGCRWIAYSKRVALPRRFSMGQRGFWFPPWPGIGEFETQSARRLEVIGRILVYVALSLIIAESLLD